MQSGGSARRLRFCGYVAQGVRRRRARAGRVVHALLPGELQPVDGMLDVDLHGPRRIKYEQRRRPRRRRGIRHVASCGATFFAAVSTAGAFASHGVVQALAASYGGTPREASQEGFGGEGKEHLLLASSNALQ